MREVFFAPLIIRLLFARRRAEDTCRDPDHRNGFHWHTEGICDFDFRVLRKKKLLAGSAPNVSYGVVLRYADVP